MKVSERKLDVLFKEFQDDLVKMTQDIYYQSYPNSPEPMMFIATTNSATKAIIDQNPKLAQSLVMASDGKMPYDPNDEKLSVLGIPLGIFFNDHGHESVNQFSKIIARQTIWKAIELFEKAEEGGVLFVCFISECWVRLLKDKPTKEEADYIMKHGIGHLSESHFKKDECVVMLFEAKDESNNELFFNIERNHDDGHQFIFRKNNDEFIADHLLDDGEKTSRGGLFSDFFKPFNINPNKEY